jgi:DNA modification methylase
MLFFVAMADLKITYREVSKLTPYVGNARTHSEKQVQQIAASIEEFGFVNPILVNGQGVVIAGHGRLMAAISLGMKTVPCIDVGYLSERQWKALVLADNRIAMSAGWDFEKLSEELSSLAERDFDLDLLGFDEQELDGLLKADAEILPEDFGQPESSGAERSYVSQGLTEDDAVPDEPVVPVSVLGDVWVLGSHRLMCGDSTSREDVAVLMEGKKADMVFTDPPYNVNYGNIKHPKLKVREIINDNMSDDDFRSFCRAFISVIKEFVESCVYIAGPPGKHGRIMFTEADQAMHCSTTIVWNKDQFTLGRGKYQNKYEPIWFGWVIDGKSFTSNRTMVNVWDFDRPRNSELHPTMKPVELVVNAIAHNPGAKSVLDLFGGSGTTLIACEITDRVARLMELDPKYVDVIIKRWEEFTGKKAVHEELNITFDEVKVQRQG